MAGVITFHFSAKAAEVFHKCLHGLMKFLNVINSS